MVNKVLVEGRLMKAPEIRVLPSKKEAVRLVLVYSRKYQDKNKQWKEELSFFEIEVYSPTLIRKAKNLNKGDRILVEGELRQNKWMKNDKVQSKVRIKANRLQLIAKPKSSTVVMKNQATVSALANS